MSLSPMIPLVLQILHKDGTMLELETKGQLFFGPKAEVTHLGVRSDTTNSHKFTLHSFAACFLRSLVLWGANLLLG